MARKFTDEQEQEICRRYLAGENTVELAKTFGVSDSCITRILTRRGVRVRGRQGGVCRLFTTQSELDELRRLFEQGYRYEELAKYFNCQRSTVGKALRKAGVPPGKKGEYKRPHVDHTGEKFGRLTAIRLIDRDRSVIRHASYEWRCECGNKCIRSHHNVKKSPRASCGCLPTGADTVEKALDGTYRFGGSRECSLYVSELARYSMTHCKPGIAFDADARARSSAAEGEYGEEVLRLLFATRTEAYFLEQAVLDATRGSADCPEDLLGWAGASEIRAMPASDMVPIVLRLADELEELGLWEFAARYVPMTAAQRLQCQQRALQEVAA